MRYVTQYHAKISLECKLAVELYVKDVEEEIRIQTPDKSMQVAMARALNALLIICSE